MKYVLDKRMKRTKKLFHEALLLLLQEKEFVDISISEIVRKADVNRGTFYHHYKDKVDLLDEMVCFTLSNMIKAYRKPHKVYQQMNITEISTIPFFEHFVEHKVFYKTLLNKRVPINLAERMIIVMERYYLEGIDFSLPNEHDVDYRLFCSYRVHGLIGFILNWIQRDFHYPVEFMAKQLVKIVTLNTERVYIKN